MEVAAPIHRRPGLTLYRYIAAEAFRPAIIALLGLTTVVLTQDLLVFSDLVVNRGLSAGVVGLIALYNAVPIAALMLPFAVLMGCLVALGRMGADLEILALEASGITAARLVWPVVAFAGAMTAISLVLSLSAAPWTNRTLDVALETISREKPWAQLRQGTVSRFGEWQLEAREVNARGDRLKGILLWMPDVGQTIFAQSGRIEATEDGGIEVSLTEGSVLLSPKSGAKSLRFSGLTTRLPDGEELRRSSKDRLHGLPLDELLVQARLAGSDKKRLRMEIEYHRRFAMPFATLVFGVLAVPLFLTRTSFSRSSGGVLGLLCTISYYGLVQLGEGLAHSETIGVAAAAWLPNAVLALLAAALLVRARREGNLGRKFERRQRSTIAFDPRRWLRAGSTLSVRHGRRELRSKRFPLPRYIAARFTRLALLSFAILLVAYLLIDIMERLDWFSRHQASGLEIIRFYGARVVLLASRVVPMSLLVATSLTVSLLAVEGELIGMRSCGIPAPRALLPVFFIAALVVPADAILNNVLVPRTNALADELKRTEIKGDDYRKRDERRKAAVWYRSGNRILEAELFDPDRGVAQELSIYEIGDDRLPVARIDAASARHVGNGWWILVDPVRIEVTDGRVTQVPAPRFANLGEALPAEVDTMHLSVAALGALIEETESDNIDSSPLRVDFHVKLAEPLACIVLPAVLLLFAVAGPPFPGPAQTLLVSAIVGISYILITGVFRSLGYGGAIPAIVGGWGPAALFTSAAGYFGLRLWRRM